MRAFAIVIALLAAAGAAQAAEINAFISTAIKAAPLHSPPESSTPFSKRCPSICR